MVFAGSSCDEDFNAGFRELVFVEDGTHDVFYLWKGMGKLEADVVSGVF